MPEIIVKFGDKTVQNFVTEKQRISIGRGSDSDIVLDNKAVSRKHSIIEFKGDTAVVIDNESLNGTFINGRKVSEEIINDGDVITIGKYDLVFHSKRQSSDSLIPDDVALEGTMVLQTKRQEELIKKDREDRQILEEMGGPVLIEESDGDDMKYLIDGVLTIGKSKLATIQSKGWFTSNIQAKVIRNGDRHMIVNLGKKGKLKVNGEDVDKHILKNNDVISVGKSNFRYLQGDQEQL
ncbi:MAG: FHA domain-containing protein [candidate division Zixibacteria bacterium]|nr:FHA domain-containing protein [candidate division Zixibacteria bacterium]